MICLIRGGSLAFLLFLFSASAFAQATRTWVSGVGDDVNPCSRTAPCKTFQGAISKTAAGGIISVLDPGGFGTVTITKSLTIDGGGMDGSITASAGLSGIIVNAAATDHVTIRRLSIYGVNGFGASGVRVINNSGHVTIQDTVIVGFNNGIDHSATSSTSQIHVLDTKVLKSATNGMLVNNGKATVVNSLFANSGVDGIRVNAAGRAVIRATTAADCLNLAFSSQGGRLTIEESTVSNAAFGIGAEGGGIVSVGNTVISNVTNTALFSAGGSTLTSYGGNLLTGNAADGAFTSTLGRQ
jgi:hypothetical protein